MRMIFVFLNSLNQQYNHMKKFGILILAIVIFAIIVYVTFIIAVVEIIVGAILFIVAAVFLWILWNKLKDKLS